MEHHPYRRGFLFGTVPPPELPSHYRLVSTNLFLYADDATRHATASAGGAAVHLIGDPVDPDHPRATSTETAARLAAALARGLPGFTTVADRLVGRFVILRQIDDQPACIQTDVTGMYSLFHARAGGAAFVASHASLAAMQIRATKGPRFVPQRWGTWGNLTRFPGVTLHSPSLELCLADGSTRRLFPGEGEGRSSVSDCAELMVARASATLEGLTSRGKVIISLTAGGDTRATLAIARRIGAEPRFFTYEGGRPHPKIDLRVARAIARDLGLDHVVVPRTPLEDIPEGLRLALEQSTTGRHGWNLTHDYREWFGVDQVVHVRSNVIEFFRRSAVDKTAAGIEIRPATPEAAARLYLAATNNSWTADTLAACTRAFARQFGDGKWEEALARIDPRDFYFVEHRMANWHANLVIESDPAFDTCILFNSRELFEAARAIPKDERMKGTLIERVYQIAAPEVLKLPINPKTFPAGETKA